MKKLSLFLVVSCTIVLISSCDSLSDQSFFNESFPDFSINSQMVGGNFDKIQENPFVSVSDEPVSTFSVDADGASYTFIRYCLRHDAGFDNQSVRIEELINYFPFDYAEPDGTETVALNAEVGDCPWAEGHKVMRLGLKGKSLTADETPLSNYVFLIDVSGSMDSDSKLPLLKTSLKSLVDLLRPEDRISIITYSGTVTKLLESTPASQTTKIKNAISKLSASGCTAGGEALKMAYEEALDNYIEGGNNRVIMGTDGDFNVGVTDTDALLEMVQNYSSQGVYLTVCGFGYGNLNDSMMETVSNKGNGTYEYIADEDDMLKVFVRESSKFYSVANDCKIQLTFNPEAVAQYRLIGYENRIMSNEEFENDDKDAAEIGAGQTITALYEIIPAEGYSESSRCAVFDFRYKKALSEASRLISLDVNGGNAQTENFNFACAVASFGMLLRQSEYMGTSSYEMVENLVSGKKNSFDPYGYRREFLSLVSIASNPAEREY